MDKRYGKKLKKEDLIGRENGILVCIDLVDIVHKKNNWDYIVLAKCKNCGSIFKISWNNFRASSRKNCKSCIHCMGKMMEDSRTKETGFTKHERLRFATIKNGAKQRNLEFKLSDNELKTLMCEKCRYCGKEHADGIDRIDSSKGYTIDNVVPCCAICNRMKSNYPFDLFKSQVEKIYKTLTNED